MKNQLFESYMKRASMFITEDEDLEDVDLDTEEGEEEVEELDADEGDEELEDEDAEDEEALELDLSNPVCPECGAKLIPVGGVESSDVDDEEAEDGEADAIELLTSLGYVVYKAEDMEDDEEGELEDEEDEFADEDEEDFEDEEF